MHIYWRSICVSCFSWSRVARNKILAFGLIIALAAAAVPARAAGWDGANFTSADIGNPALIGSSTFTNLGLTMTAGGLDIGGNSDQGRFTYREQTGDFDLKVRIQSLGNSDVWAKAGLMARESLEANSASAAVLATPNLSGCFLLTRAAAGSPTVMKGNFPANYPATWLRVQRTGDVFQGYASLDGQSWSLLGTATMALTNRVLLGFMAASHSTNQVTTAEFRDFAEAAGGSVGGLPVSSESLGPCSRKTGLVISEIMYHPAARTDGKNLEFVELYNTNPFFEDISGYRLAGDIDFTFPNGTVLPGGGFLIVAKAPADMQSVYGLARVLGPYSQALKRSGTVRLLDRIDSIYLEINYSNQPPWPVAADGTGHSLVLARPSYGEGNPQAWSASDLKGGSPGQVGAVRTGPLQNVTINEFLANSELPQKDYIELYNHGNSPQDLSGCFLSDDPATNKFRLPVGTVIPARGFIVFAEDQLDFALNSEGETIYFTNPDENQVLDAVRFEPQAVGIAMGRVPDGAGEFYPLAKQTPGAANGDILVHDIVINEIMYNPISGDPDDQYVELFNRGKTATDLGGWRFTAGIDLVMPSPTLLPAGGYLVIARNVSHLRQTYPHLGAGTTVGNFQGKLARGGERLALAKPESTVDPVTGETRTTYAVVDEVAYQTGGRWPRWADGGGSSLELIDPRSNHRLASNWADSDETHKAEWTTIEATGVLELGVGTIDSLHVLLLGEGECLVDNVEVLGSDGTTNLIANSTFENGLGNWVCQGDHIRSSLETTEGYQSQKSLHLRASNQGDTGANRIRVPLASSTALRPGQTATLRAKVRWLRGFPEIVLRLKGN
jgi:regulation of enolase protein 1 (concanavalin A-like superfamily)